MLGVMPSKACCQPFPRTPAASTGRSPRCRRIGAVVAVIVLRWLGLLGLGLTLGACARLWPEITGASSATAASGEAFFSTVDGLPVHVESSAHSKIIGRIGLHEKVARTRVEHGYALISSTVSGVSGWVDNAQLSWRVPPDKPAVAHGAGQSTHRTPSAPATQAVIPAASSVSPPAPKAAAVGAAPPALTPADVTPVPVVPAMPAADEPRKSSPASPKHSSGELEDPF